MTSLKCPNCSYIMVSPIPEYCPRCNFSLKDLQQYQDYQKLIAQQKQDLQRRLEQQKQKKVQDIKKQDEKIGGFKCRNCGKNIDSYQYNNFSGLCPDCVRRRELTLKTIRSESSSGTSQRSGYPAEMIPACIGMIAFFIAVIIVIIFMIGSYLSGD